jgi:heme exporter protein CcmB
LGVTAVVASQLSRRFGQRWALNDVSFTLEPHECLAIFGPNGAGKTTLLKIVAGLLNPTRGTISPEHRSVGLISHQTMLYPELTALENVEFAAQLHRVPYARAAAHTALTALGVADRADTPVRQLSRGLQQRVSIARAFVHAPSIVLLDEPFTGLDAVGARVLTEALVGLKDTGAALILVTHNLDEGLSLGTQVAVLRDGRFVSHDRRESIDPVAFATRYRSSLGDAVSPERAPDVAPSPGHVWREAPTRTSLARSASLIARKDLRVEFRSRSAFFSAVIFAVLAATIFFFAWDPTAVGSADLAPGVLWVIFTFAGMLGLHRSFGAEITDRAIDGLLVAPIDRKSVFIGKALANLVFVLAVQAIAIPAVGIMYSVPFASIGWALAGITVLAAIGLVAIGTLFSAMTVNTRFAELLLPMLSLPFFVPIVIAAAQSTAKLLSGRPLSEAAAWLEILASFDLVFVYACTLAFPATLER